jgi:hypothetical protein
MPDHSAGDQKVTCHDGLNTRVHPAQHHPGDGHRDRPGAYWTAQQHARAVADHADDAWVIGLANPLHLGAIIVYPDHIASTQIARTLKELGQAAASAAAQLRRLDHTVNLQPST